MAALVYVNLLDSRDYGIGKVRFLHYAIIAAITYMSVCVVCVVVFYYLFFVNAFVGSFRNL